jgi:phosphate transport system protein
MHDELPLMEGHISKTFDGELAALQLHVVQMGGLVLAQVRHAIEAHARWDAGIARRVLEQEAEVNAFERNIDAEQFALLARRSPLASDLRVVVAMSKCIAELERAGDEAKKIAATVLRQGRRPGPDTSEDAQRLGELALGLLRLALEALDRIDGDTAALVIARDRELDTQYAQGLRRLLRRPPDETGDLETIIEAAFALKALERIGDHARNLARQVRGVVTEALGRDGLRQPA